MARVRLGVAILLHDPIKSEINGLRRALGDQENIERIAPHITLVPPVNVRVDEFDAALRVVRRAAANMQPFELTLGPVESFAPATPVIKLDVGGDTTTLRALRDAIFVPPLQRILTWPFVPHVTLLDGATDEQIDAALGSLRSYETTITADAVQVLQEGTGRVWRPVADAFFEAPIVIGTGGLETELTSSTIVDPMVRERLAIEQETDLVVTARRDGGVVGSAAGRLRAGAMVLEVLEVMDGHRGTGVGTHLVRQFRQVARARHDAPVAHELPDCASFLQRFSIPG